MIWFGPVHFENLIKSSNGDINKAIRFIKKELKRRLLPRNGILMCDSYMVLKINGNSKITQ